MTIRMSAPLGKRRRRAVAAHRIFAARARSFQADQRTDRDAVALRQALADIMPSVGEGR